ncbi:hypothetical protein BSCH_02641 [Candidatus Paraburkholderia schumanniana]|nr:hypothetical protein BSCH_02641 [Candidatus Paraburkholderia schumannianae]
MNFASRSRKAPPTKHRRLDPITIFAGAYLAYNLLGLPQAPWMIANAYDKALCWNLFLLGLAGLAFGAWLGRKLFRVQTSKQLSIFFLTMFCGCIAFAVIASNGIPLLQCEDRFGNSALVSNLAPFYGFWVLVRMISDAESGRRPSPVPPIVYMAGVLVLGYRSPVLTFVLTYTCYLAIFRLSRRRAVWCGLLVGIALVVFAASLALFRVSQSYDPARFFANVDMAFMADHPYLLPLMPALSMFDFSQSTIVTLGKVVHEPMLGRLLLSNLETFLPGKHWGTRNIIGDLTGARWIAGRPMSITPTLQGALFVDFGHAGVFAGFTLLSMAIRACYVAATSGGPLPRFCFFFAMALMAIHAGYWDVSFVFVGVFVLTIKVFDQLKAFSRAHESPARMP